MTIIVVLLGEWLALALVGPNRVDPSSIPFGACFIVHFDEHRNVAGVCSATLIGHNKIITASHCKRANAISNVRCGGEVRALAPLPLAIYEDSVELEVTSPFSKPSEIVLPQSIAGFRSQITRDTECFLYGQGGDQGLGPALKMEGVRVSVPTTRQQVGKASLTNRPYIEIPLWAQPHYHFDRTQTASYNPDEENSNFLRRNYMRLPPSEVLGFSGDSGGGLMCKDAAGKLNLVGVTSSTNSSGEAYMQSIVGLIDQINRRSNCP